MQLEWSVIPDYLDQFASGAEWTLFIAIVAIIFGFGGGLLLGMARISKNRALNYIATGYIEAFRGTPLLVQIFLIYFGMPSLGFTFTAITAGIMAMSLNSAAYQAEIFRAGVQSIPKGQMEASRSMGMTHNQSMFNVIIPQALRNSLPTYTNEFITLIKDSSLVMTIGVMELMYSGKYVIGHTFQPFVVYIFIAVIYFIMTFSTSRIMRYVERRFAIPGTMGGA